MFRGPAGLPSLMKEGASHFKGREEATLRNIDAANKLLDTVRSSYGPNGMCKLVNNYIDKRYLTADGSTILSQLEVQHPAAKILAMASEMQNTEFGDGTLFVIMFAAELLNQAGALIQDGVHESFIIKGYEMALAKALTLMEAEVVKNMSAKDNVTDGPSDEMIRPLVASKIAGEVNVNTVTSLIRKACAVALATGRFNSDNIRVTKLTGGSLSGDSEVINGMVLLREPRTDLKEKSNARVIILGTGLEPMTTEGTSTVLITKSDEMKSFTQSEEQEMKKLIQYWKEDLKIDGVICGGTICDIALHYLNEFEMWACQIPSRFDLKRLSRTLGAPVLARPDTSATANSNRILSDDVGAADYIGVAEFGGKMVSVIRGKDSHLATILLRGMSMVIMEEYERCIDDCISLVSASIKDSRFVAGGGHTEYRLAKKIDEYAETVDGIEQYAIQRFAEALKVFPKTLAENAGQNALETLALLNAQMHQDAIRYGVNICRSSGDAVIRDIQKHASEEKMFKELAYPVYDHYLTKEWAIRLACDAALTLLRVDQIIMSKPAGGPKMQSQGHWDAADDRQPAF